MSVLDLHPQERGVRGCGRSIQPAQSLHCYPRGLHLLWGPPKLHATALGKRVRLPVTSPPLFSFKMRLQGNLKLVWLEKGSLMPDACINRAEHSVTVCKAGREALPAPIPTGPPRKAREEEREHGATARNGSTLSHGF